MVNFGLRILNARGVEKLIPLPHHKYYQISNLIIYWQKKIVICYKKVHYLSECILKTSQVGIHKFYISTIYAFSLYKSFASIYYTLKPIFYKWNSYIILIKFSCNNHKNSILYFLLEHYVYRKATNKAHMGEWDTSVRLFS